MKEEEKKTRIGGCKVAVNSPKTQTQKSLLASVLAYDKISNAGYISLKYLSIG